MIQSIEEIVILVHMKQSMHKTLTKIQPLVHKTGSENMYGNSLQLYISPANIYTSYEVVAVSIQVPK